MSLLISMRQRIKTIETIQKITHAMQLISMATHNQLRAKNKFLKPYKEELHTLFAQAYAQVPDWNHPVMAPKQGNKHLIVLVGSQKGLCGNFNPNLYFFAQKHIATTFNLDRKKIELIVIGRKIHEYTGLLSQHIIHVFDTFSFASLESISKQITTVIFNAPIPYSSVIVFANYPKTFFNQKPTAYTIIPFQPSPAQSSTKKESLIWQQPPQLILNYLAEQLILTSIQEYLFLSLIAEQSARFIAMDNATRNASTMLETMQLNYNKLRQAKITRELSDLIGGLY